MGTLFSGRYGSPPDAESSTLPLQECVIRLGLKPSDFVSQGEPAFFKERFGSRGRYVLFQVQPQEVEASPIWKFGFYLLPLEAADVQAAFNRRFSGATPVGAHRMPIQLDAETAPSPDVEARARAWAEQCQPLFFKCKCDHLELRLDAPWGLRRHWKARLRCPNRCQPAQSTRILS